MPELPEVETIVGDLSSRLKGLSISSIRIFHPHVLRGAEPLNLDKLDPGRVKGIRRRGKMIVIDCEKGWSLLIHLGMTGKMIFSSSSEPVEKHTHFSIAFHDSGQELRFHDVRKFGYLSCLQTSHLPLIREWRSLGPEPLEVDFPHFAGLFKGRKARLKSLLLDQSFIAGIGNIYADEILFRAGLNPFLPASRLGEKELRRLWREIRRVLREAIAHRGSSIRDYRDAAGRQGSFQLRHRVYGRESLRCSCCRQPIVKQKLSQRSSYYCPRCQPLLRERAP